MAGKDIRKYKKPLFIFLLGLLAISKLFSQDYSLFGEAEAVMEYERGYGEVPEQSLSGNIRLSANHRLYLPSAEAFAHHELFVYPDASIDHKLYEAYILLPLQSWFQLQLGRQFIQWGHGINFIPSDALHNRGGKENRQQLGFDGAAVYLSPNPDLSFTLVADMGEALRTEKNAFQEEISLGAEASFFLYGLDGSLSFIYQYNEILRPAAGFSIDIVNFILSSEVALEFYNNVQYPEEDSASPYGIRFTQRELGKANLLVSGGVSRSFMTDELTFSLAAEYLYTDTGYGNNETELLYDLLGVLGSLESLSSGSHGFSAPDYLGKHYVFASVGFEYLNNVRTNHSMVINAQDGSAYFSHALTLIRISAIDLYVSGAWVLGEHLNSEFGLNPYRLQLQAGTVVHF